MSYCLNPACTKPQNPLPSKFCQTCGSILLLKERYRALSPIGEGGFGRTFVAIDEHRLQTRCVIKQFLPQAKGSGTVKQTALEKAVQMFNREAVRLDELGGHSQIPTLLAYFEQESRLYLVQQFIEGQNLFQELYRQGPFNEAQIRELLADLLPVLKFVHERNVIHRDIKPSNIIRTQGSRKLVLIDFGVAKQLTENGMTKIGTKIGTEGYAPIEQWRGGKAYPASDLYSLGATCVHLLTRVKPDSLYDPVAGRWFWQEQLQSQGVTLSPRLEQILTKLLKDAVVERYQSADEVLQDLEDRPVPLSPGGRPAGASVPINTPISGNLSTDWHNVHTLVGHGDRVRTVAISPDGQLLVSGSSDKSIKLWDLSQGALLQTLTGHTGAIHAVIVHPNGRVVISASSDKTIRLWHLTKGQLLHTFTDHTNWVNTLAIGAKGQLLASGSDDQTIKVWNLKTGQLMHNLTGHSGPVHAVAISPDGKTLISGSSDKSIRVWNLVNGTLALTLTRHSSRVNSVAISPNGLIAASGSDDGTVKLWELQTGQVLHTLTDHEDAVSGVAISVDGKYLVSGSHDNTVRVWDLPSGRWLNTLSGHTWWVNTVAIGAQSYIGGTLTRIASGSADKSIHVWQTGT